MDEQFTKLRRVFNTLGSRWVTSGDMAASIHARHLGVTSFRNPKQFDFIIGIHNREKFENVLRQFGYELITTKSSRKNLRFERRGLVPVNLHLTPESPRGMSYNSKTPLERLEKLSNVNKLVNYKKKIHTMVNNLMRNINLNVN
jgi:hypothetical protein